MNEKLEPIEGVIPIRLKRAIMMAGGVLTVLGLPPALNLFCIVPFSLLRNEPELPVYVMVSLILVTVTLAAGGATLYHSNQSLNGKPSKRVRLPSVLFLMGIFAVLLIVGIFVNVSEFLPGVFIPPLLFLAATLPPLWAISWFMGRDISSVSGLTWRRGVVAFAGGASVAVFIAIFFEILLPAGILMLGFDLFGTVTNSLDTFFRVLGRTQWTSAWMVVLASPRFVYVLLQYTLIAPLVEEFAKPLVTLPILRHLNRQETFWIGAIAGAGFAVLEGSIYATIGFRLWVEFLFVRALGSAIQPLGSGLVTLGWWAVLRGEPVAWDSWWRRFGIAVVMHAAWNAASLLVVFLGEGLITGNLLLAIGWPGITALGMLFIFLILLGSSALWFGRILGQGGMLLFPGSKKTPEAESASSNRTMAIWALASLMVILPAGIVLLRLWLR